MSLRGHYKAAAVNVEATAKFLIVRYGSRYCALPSEGVRGVLTVEEAGNAETVTRMGAVYQNVDLAGLLSTTVDATSQDRRTVLFSNGHSHGAIRVDEVIGMIEIDREQCRPLPPHFQRDERTWIVGTFIVREELALILNPEWILGELGEVVGLGTGAQAGRALGESTGMR